MYTDITFNYLYDKCEFLLAHMLKSCQSDVIHVEVYNKTQVVFKTINENFWFL